MKPIRVAILQRVCTAYRRGLFRRLSTTPGHQVRVFIGQDLPDSKVRSASDLSGIDVVALPTRFVQWGGHVLVVHRGLLKALGEFHPDVILCEGESNLVSYLKAVWHRRAHKNVALVHWSLGGLPGVPIRRTGLRSRIKYLLQRRFDAMLAYSGFGRDCLVSLGHPADKVFVATNVADTTEHLEMCSRMRARQSPGESRSQLGLPDRFTVLYAGAMDANKRPGLMVDLACQLDSAQYNFVLLGAGPMLELLRERVTKANLRNVFLPGRIGKELPLYYHASNVMVLPGRGGMVISEAMAWSLPVIVHQADGTEYDLIRDGETGHRLAGGEVEHFWEAIERLGSDPERARAMGEAGRDRLTTQFSIEHFTSQVETAIDFAYTKRHMIGRG